MTCVMPLLERSASACSASLTSMRCTAHPQTVFHLNAPVVDGHQDVLEFAEGQGSRCLRYILSVHDQPPMTLHGGSRVFTEVRKTNPLHTSHLVPEQRYGAAKPHELLACIVVNRALDDAA